MPRNPAWLFADFHWLVGSFVIRSHPSNSGPSSLPQPRVRPAKLFPAFQAVRPLLRYQAERGICNDNLGILMSKEPDIILEVRRKSWNEFQHHRIINRHGLIAR